MMPPQLNKLMDEDGIAIEESRMTKKFGFYALLLLVILIVCQIIKFALTITLFTMAAVFIVAIMVRMQFKRLKARFSRRS